MYSFFAFVITLTELIIVIGGQLMQSHSAVYSMLIYGSPFYLLMTLFGSESIFLSKGLLYPGLLLFHLVKYFIIFRSQSEERSAMRYGAVLMEIGYLCASAYYNN